MLYLQPKLRFRGRTNSDSDGENECMQNQEIIDIETVKPPDIVGNSNLCYNQIVLT